MTVVCYSECADWVAEGISVVERVSGIVCGGRDCNRGRTVVGQFMYPSKSDDSYRGARTKVWQWYVRRTDATW